MRGPPGAALLLATWGVLGASLAGPLPAQSAREIDSGRFRIRGSGGSVATEVFAIRREPSAVKSVARLTVGSDTAVLAERITEARLQTNRAYEPVLFELQVQRGTSIDLVGVRSGSRFRVRTRSPDGERWKEFLVPSGLVVLPDGFAHFHHFLFRQHEEDEARLTALAPADGTRQPVRFLGSRPDTVRAGGGRVPATRWEVSVGGERRLIWRSEDGRVLRVEIPDRGWVAERMPEGGSPAAPGPETASREGPDPAGNGPRAPRGPARTPSNGGRQ